MATKDTTDNDYGSLPETAETGLPASEVAKRAPARSAPTGPGEHVVLPGADLELVRKQQHDAHEKRVAEAEAANLHTNKRMEDLQASYVEDSRR